MISEEEKHWLYVGLALNKTLVPELLPVLVQGVKAEYQGLKGRPHHIDTQAPAGRLTRWPITGTRFLNYVNINGNDVHKLRSGRCDYSKFTYQVSSDVDFAKLFLQPHMAKFSNLAECDASAVLNLLSSVPAFSPATQAAASAVRDNVRNQWAHCRLKEWDIVKFTNCFKDMEQLIKSFKFAAAQEGQLLGKVNEWKTKGGAMIAESLVDSSLITMATKEIALLKQEITSLDAENRERINNLNALSMKLSELEKSVKRHDLEIGSLNERMGSLKRRMDTVESSIPNKQLCAEKAVENFTSKMRQQILRTTEFESKLLDSPDVPHRKVDDIYTNMVIQMGRKKDKFCGNRSEILHAYPESSNISIEKAEELFLPIANTEDPKSILIRGRAGIGKTLFCQMLVRDWAKECLFKDEKDKNKFQFVFLFTFRQLNSIDEPLTLYEFLRYSHTCPEMTKDIYDFIISNPENTLLVFDGFDEYRYQEEMRHNIIGEKMTVGTLFTKIAAGEILANATVVITSRPEAEANLYDLKIQTDVEMLGFTKDHVRKYINKFFNRINSDQTKVVLDYILTNENIATFCYVPVNCLLVCLYVEWHLNENSGPVSAPLPLTIAELYLEVVRMFLLKHHKECRGQENPHLPDSAQNALDKLCQLSLELLKSKTFTFSDEDLEKYGLKKEEIHPLLSSGLVHCVPNYRTGRFSIKTYYCFLHLTLQEFLAACCLIKSGELIRLGQNAIEDFLDLSEMVSVFVAGLLGTLVREGEGNIFGLNVTNEIADKIMSSLTGNADRKLLVNLLYNYKEEQFVQTFLRDHSMRCLILEDVDVMTLQAIAFLLMMQVKAKHQVKNLTLRIAKGGGFKYIAEATSCEHCQLRHLNVCGCNLTELDTEHLTDALTSPNCHLTKLYCSVNQISDKGAEHFSHALKSPNCHLTQLYLCACQISDKGAEHFSHALKSPNCHLTKLHLSANQISDKGAEHLSHALKSPNCHLTRLDLDRNQISDKGAEHLSHALTSPNCHLTRLDLLSNQISVKGAEHLSHALTSPNCHLTWV